VFLATVLFLVGISGHFRVRAARYGLVGVSAVILALAVALLITSPKPPL
jgi:putative flippase GtrA